MKLIELLANYAEAPQGTIYIVTGFMRSFTSMMMRALIAGGMDAVYDPAQTEHVEKMSANLAEYHPNPNGVYEISDKIRTRFLSKPQEFEGRLLKQLCIYGWLDLPFWAGRYKVLLMLRDPAEIRESAMKLMGREPAFNDDKGEPKLPFTPEVYRHIMVRAIRQLRARRDVDFLAVVGTEVLREPIATFNRIRLDGWPIEPGRCAQIIQPELYRNRCGQEAATPAALAAV